MACVMAGGAALTRVEEVIPLSFLQRELWWLVGATQQDPEHTTLVQDVVRQRAKEEWEDHQNRERDQHIDQLFLGWHIEQNCFQNQNP